MSSKPNLAIIINIKLNTNNIEIIVNKLNPDDPRATALDPKILEITADFLIVSPINQLWKLLNNSIPKLSFQLIKPIIVNKATKTKITTRGHTAHFSLVSSNSVFLAFSSSRLHLVQ